MKKKTLRILPLGGLGEVGRNMMVYEYNDSYMIVDTGLMFPENDMLGVDYIIPDFEYLKSRADKIKGIVITHGHEDHIGAVHHLLKEIQAPIYATPLTRGLLEVKLARRGGIKDADLRTVQAGETVHIGPFQVEFFHVAHSIPDAVGLGIQTPAGLVVHTGDFKFDQTPVDNWPTDVAKLGEFSQRGVMALLSDSTNAVDSGWTPSERVVDQAFEKVFNDAEGRIIVASFASLISRMQQVANAAQAHGRKMAFFGTSMVDNAKMAQELGYLNIPDDVLVNSDEALKLPDNEVVLMCTGSQGEPRSIMGRLAMGTNRRFDIKPKDTVVLSSQAIPGNEEAVYRTINKLFKRGANVIYEGLAPVHVSGHPAQEELKLLLNLVRPKYFIPIHGEIRHLRQHAKLAAQVGVPTENIAVIENGQIMEFENGEMQFAERIPISYVFVDGSGVGDVGPEVMHEREDLAQDGVLAVHLVLNKYSQRLIAPPAVISRGFILDSEVGEMLEEVVILVSQAMDEKPANIHRAVIKTVRTYLYGKTRRSPHILVTTSEI
ncbi:MAG: ribonuclease J [Anaerolineaceae bacterium]|nr:ribonuclease J [Anaerolineaceae bacterium]